MGQIQKRNRGMVAEIEKKGEKVDQVAIRTEAPVVRADSLFPGR